MREQQGIAIRISPDTVIVIFQGILQAEASKKNTQLDREREKHSGHPASAQCEARGCQLSLTPAECLSQYVLTWKECPGKFWRSRKAYPDPLKNTPARLKAGTQIPGIASFYESALKLAKFDVIERSLDIGAICLRWQIHRQQLTSYSRCPEGHSEVHPGIKRHGLKFSRYTEDDQWGRNFRIVT